MMAVSSLRRQLLNSNALFLDIFLFLSSIKMSVYNVRITQRGKKIITTERKVKYITCVFSSNLGAQLIVQYHLLSLIVSCEV